jgi:hypothetical protein
MDTERPFRESPIHAANSCVHVVNEHLRRAVKIRKHFTREAHNPWHDQLLAMLPTRAHCFVAVFRWSSPSD